MLDHIEDDWSRWVVSPRGRHHREGWARADPSLGGWSPAELRAPRSTGRTDAMQAALVGLAQRGDQAAMTTLIVQLRPGLLRLVRWVRTTYRHDEPAGDTVHDLIGLFTETVMRHPLDRRPRLIAANLLLDTKQKIWRAETRARRLSAEVALDGDDRLVSHPETDHVAARLDIFGGMSAALGAMPGTAASRRLTAEVAFRAWILDEPSGDIAAEVGLRPAAVRARLSRLRAAVRGTAGLRRSGVG